MQGTVRLALLCSYRRTTGVHLPVFTLKALPWRDSSGGREQNDKNLLRDANVLGTEDNRDPGAGVRLSRLSHLTARI